MSIKSKKNATAAAAAAAELAAVDAATAARVAALQNCANAENNRVNALVAAVATTVTHGTYSAEEIVNHFVAGSSVAVYRSNFNLGHKAGLLIGEAKALKLIEDTAKTVAGKKYDAVLDALRAVVAAGKAAGGELSGKAVTATVKAAQAAVVEGVAKRNAAAEARKAPRAPKNADTAPADESAASLPRPRRVAQAVARAGAGFAPMADALRILANEARTMAGELTDENARAAAMLIESLEACAATAALLGK